MGHRLTLTLQGEASGIPLPWPGHAIAGSKPDSLACQAWICQFHQQALRYGRATANLSVFDWIAIVHCLALEP